MNIQKQVSTVSKVLAKIAYEYRLYLLVEGTMLVNRVSIQLKHSLDTLQIHMRRAKSITKSINKFSISFLLNHHNNMTYTTLEALKYQVFDSLPTSFII